MDFLVSWGWLYLQVLLNNYWILACLGAVGILTNPGKMKIN
jgi:hypothetical protein